MFGRIKRKKARVAVAVQANRMEMLEDRRLMTISDVQVTAPNTVDEGSTFEIQFDAQTDGQITQWEIDVGYGPTFYSGSIRSLLVNFDDGDTTRNISVTAHDQSFNGTTWVTDSQSAGASVAVKNVAPSFTVNAEEQAFVGEPFWISWTNFVEPGADTLTEWEVDWGDGTVETYDPNIGSFVHTYDRELNAQVIVTAIDEDGRHVGQPIDQQVKFKHLLQVDHATGFDDDETFSGTVVEATNPNQWVNDVEVTIRMTDAERVRSGITLDGAEQDPATGDWILKKTSKDGGKFSFRLHTNETRGTSVMLTFESKSAPSKTRQFTLNG